MSLHVDMLANCARNLSRLLLKTKSGIDTSDIPGWLRNWFTQPDYLVNHYLLLPQMFM